MEITALFGVKSRILKEYCHTPNSLFFNADNPHHERVQPEKSDAQLGLDWVSIQEPAYLGGYGFPACGFLTQLQI